jgi:hypothetical protein
MYSELVRAPEEYPQRLKDREARVAHHEAMVSALEAFG